VIVRYKVSLNGHNFLLDIDGKVRRLGFYTHRIVEAGDESEAEQVAIQALRSHPTLVARRNPPGNPASVTVDEIELAQANDSSAQPGLVLYPEESED